METIIKRNYIDIEYMYECLLGILKEERDEFKDGEVDGFLDDNYPDDVLEERAKSMAWEFNDDMERYLHMTDHKIYGNFNNVDYDYPHHINGKVVYDHPLVDDLIKRLDEGREDKQTESDRHWLVDWFFDTFGSFGIKYNFDSEMSDSIYDYRHECETA